ncbi:MAG TPA: tetratricopeptide repeat protein [Methylophilaceae bacterium]
MESNRSDIDSRAHDAFKLLNANQPDQAERICNTILESDPKHFDALHCLGIAHFQRSRFDQAVIAFTHALEVRPDSDIYSNLGLALAKLNLHKEAVDCYDAAVSLNANNAIAYYNRGNSLLHSSKLAEALENYDHAIAINPAYAAALSNRGNVLRSMKLLPQALASYDQAITLMPENAMVLNNRGVIWMELNRPADALNDYDRALAITPDYTEALYNKGNALLALRQIESASEYFDKSVATDLDNADAHLNRALFLLATGDFEQGWAEYEWRWKRGSFEASHHFSQPLWTGKEELAGKTILLYAEQGLGDTIQFVRYIRMVKALGANIILEVQAPLKSLMSTLENVDQLVVQGEELPPFDYHCMLMSLPFTFNSSRENIPAPTSYLKTPNDKSAYWSDKLGELPAPKIGISWSGNPDHKNDHNRSIPLQWLINRLPPEFNYISLQKELREADREALESNTKLLSFTEQLQDFSDLAGLIDHLDMVISVDTSVAHLAGALGKPVCILLPYSPDWRWMQSGESSPWYPTAKLFRQPALSDWESAIDQLNQYLRKFLTQNSLG